MKTNAPLTPVPKLRGDIFRNENNPAGAANLVVVFRVGLWGQEQKKRNAIRRRNPYQAMDGFEADIKDHIESELVPVESHASIVIANEDRGAVNPQIRVLPVQSKRGLGPIRPIAR
jgi:hypothetical protein